LVEERPELVFGNVLLIERNIEFALDLSAGTLGVAQETDKLHVAATVESFGDVVHD
jgi:hypothetical protein